MSAQVPHSGRKPYTTSGKENMNLKGREKSNRKSQHNYIFVDELRAIHVLMEYVINV